MVIMKRVCGSALLVFALLAGSQAVASAGLGWTPPPGPHPPKSPTPSPPSSSGQGSSRDVDNCHLYGGPEGFGLSCGTRSGAKGDSVAEILGGDPVPACWDEAASAQDVANLGVTDTTDFDYYWRWCLTGVNPKTKTVTGKGIGFTRTFTWLPKGTKDCAPLGKRYPIAAACRIGLTQRQRELVDMQARDTMIPSPAVVAKPAAVRVRVSVAFVDDDAVTDKAISWDGHEATVGPIAAGAVQMRALLLGYRIDPTGTGQDAFDCPGFGRVVPPDGATPATAPAACWYRTGYAHSSARQTGEAYPVTVTATWVIQYDAGGGWQPLGDPFDKTQQTPLRVSEIQTLVIN
jgi:hypothetical protein